MKPISLAGTTLLALLALEPAAHAQRVNFAYTGKVVTYTVPATGLYQITAYGAQGGTGGSQGIGGLGAEIAGDFTLTLGEVLQIAVGQVGLSSDLTGGGGGGTFVVANGSPLLIAGGGGGGSAGSEYFGPMPGGGGLIGQNGGGTGVGQNGGGGINGNGGNWGDAGGVGIGGGGGGGAGFYSSGISNPFFGGEGTGGLDWLEGLAGGIVGGGFGGGGGAACGAGGGGGYSGGAGGGQFASGCYPGGGGGSFDAGIDQILTAGTQTGDGEVVINTIFVGTPGKPNCHGEVVSNLAQQYGGLDAAAAALGYSSVQVLQSGIATYCAGAMG